LTVSVDGKTLHVRGDGIKEDTYPVGTFTDQYINETYSKKGSFLGQYKTWVLQCYEDNVAWTSCNAKHLQEQLDAGDSVVLVIDEGNLHDVTSTNVYILGLSISYKKGSTTTKFLRNYILTLQEAPV
jgi:hypothetical protein